MLNNTQKIILIASGAATALAIKTRMDANRDAKKSAKITSIIREIEATFAAYEAVSTRVANGDYRDKSSEDIKTDFEFEQIAYLEK